MTSSKNVVMEKSPSNSKYEDDRHGNRNLSLQQKLDMVDEELHKIHMFCINSGYSPSQIHKFVEPFSEKMRQASRRKWIKRLVNLCIVIIVACFLFTFDPVNKFCYTIGRRAAIQVMPIYDWTMLYESNCLIENPLHESQNILKLDDCNVCENLNRIDRVKDIDEADLIQKYMKQDKPVIVEDGLKQNNGDKFTVQFLKETFEHSLYDSCDFTSNVKVQGHRTFLKQVAANEHKEYFAFWKNCFEEPAKELRYHFKRPYFLSSVVELSDVNWVYISSNYTAKLPKQLFIDGPMVMLMQMKGSVEVVLVPDKVCSQICSEITEVLHEGQILLVNDFLWFMDYYPGGEDENVGIGVSGSFD